MSFAGDIRAVRHSALKPLGRLLLMVMLSHKNEESGTFPSIATLAGGTGMSPSTVKEWRRVLMDMGIVTVSGPRSGGRRTNRYEFDLENLPLRNRPGAGGLNRPPAGYHPAGSRPPGSREPATTPPGAGHEQLNNKAIEQTNNSTAAVVVGILGSDALLRQFAPNQDQLDWIAREAPGKESPAGWAADAIRHGWKPKRPSNGVRHLKAQGAH